MSSFWPPVTIAIFYVLILNVLETLKGNIIMASARYIDFMGKKENVPARVKDYLLHSPVFLEKHSLNPMTSQERFHVESLPLNSPWNQPCLS